MKDIKFAASQAQEDALRAASERVRRAEAELSEAAEARKQLVREVLEAGVTQAQVAQIMGLSQPRISIMASGK